MQVAGALVLCLLSYVILNQYFQLDNVNILKIIFCNKMIQQVLELMMETMDQQVITPFNLMVQVIMILVQPLLEGHYHFQFGLNFRHLIAGKESLILELELVITMY